VAQSFVDPFPQAVDAPLSPIMINRFSIAENSAAAIATRSLPARHRKRRSESREFQLNVDVRQTLQAESNLLKAAARLNRLNIVFVAFIDFTTDNFSDTL
jgi:hypothetical protein